MSLTIHISTRHAIMLRESKCTPCAPSQKMKHNKCVWITVDTGDSTDDEYDATRADAIFRSNKSGKFCGQCKFHSRYQDCTLRMRKYLLLAGTKTYEETGEHIHSLETFACGLPQRCKDEIVTLLTLNNKFKPTIIRTIIGNKSNVSSNEKEHNQTCGFITRKLELLSDEFE